MPLRPLLPAARVCWRRAAAAVLKGLSRARLSRGEKEHRQRRFGPSGCCLKQRARFAIFSSETTAEVSASSSGLVFGQAAVVLGSSSLRRPSCLSFSPSLSQLDEREGGGPLYLFFLFFSFLFSFLHRSFAAAELEQNLAKGSQSSRSVLLCALESTLDCLASAHSCPFLP